jgi:hypothetical protein
MTHFDWARFHEKKNVVFDVTVPGLVPISAVPFGDGRVLVAGVDLEGGPVCVLLDATEERPMPTTTESTKGTGRVWNHFPAHEFGGCWGVEHCASTRPGSSLVVGLGPFAVAVTASGLAVFDPCTEAPSRRVVQVIPCPQRPTSIGWALGAKWLMVTMGEWMWRIARAERTDELVAESLQPTDQPSAPSQPTHDLPLKLCPRRSMGEIADLVTRDGRLYFEGLDMASTCAVVAGRHLVIVPQAHHLAYPFPSADGKLFATPLHVILVPESSPDDFAADSRGSAADAVW